MALSPAEIAYCCMVIVAAYVLRGSTGIGSAAAMPLLALVVPLKILVPVWTLLGISSSITIVGRDWRHIATKELLHALPASLVGIAVGLYAFTMLDSQTLARGLGALVAAYGCHSLWRQRTNSVQAATRAPGRVIAVVAGVLGGAVGTAFGTMATIFFAIYFDAIDMAKRQFRATISAMLLALSIIRGFGYYVVGEFNRETLLVFAIAFPMMLLGIFIGDRLQARITNLAFKRIVSTIFIASGLALVVR